MAYANTGTVFAAPLAEREARPSLFSRIMDALTESRRHKAQRHINAHAHLLREFGAAGNEIAQPNGTLPFIG